MNPLITSDLDLAAAEPESELDEKGSEEVTNITPDDSMDSLPDGATATEQTVPLADDYDAMKKEYFKPPPDLETLDESVSTWTISNWNDLEKKEHGPIFECGGFPWRALFFPFGNNQSESCSFYLEHAFGDKPSENWYACVQFMLVLWNPKDPSIHTRHDAIHRYNAEESDWGFTRYFELRRLVRGINSDGRGILQDGAANMTAYVRVLKDPTGVLWHSFINYDSKKETGMVGLKNQGATCYLNSLLQSLYFTNIFRKALYQIPTENETDVRDNKAYALQRLFFLLQSSDTAISTGELTTSFGWESRQIFEQQDVQELLRILMDKMEERMKGTKAEKALASFFVGQMKTYISCIHVDYESSRPEDYWDIQLNVRGNPTLDDSFKDYIQVETMDGDNKYFAEGFGLQDAKKGVIFESFPPVLHLQLKRFEYTVQADAMTKVYDRYEFPEVWDASPYLSQTADRSEPYIYHLHSVLVHSGDLNAGHYYAFIKPHKNGKFYKFDDDRVTPATTKEALDENFGGDFAMQPNGIGARRNPYTRTISKQKFMSAYMLVYIRESRMDEVMQTVQEEDVPPHLERKLNEERAELERRKREREEAHLYMNVVVASDVQFGAHQGLDIYPAPNQPYHANHPSSPKQYKMLRSMTLGSLIKTLAADYGVDEDLVRPWGLVGRQNGTLRPDSPLDSSEKTIEETANGLQIRVPLRIWIELATRNAEGEPDFYDVATLSNIKEPTQPILLFLKYFDVNGQSLRGQGHVFIGKHRRISELGPMILERMGWSSDVNLKLWEEIKASMVESINTKSTFASAELQHGDIICFHEVLPEDRLQPLQEAGKYIEPPSFYRYLQHRVEVNFTDRKDVDQDGANFSLELSKVLTYDQIATRVGEHLKVEPTHLRFWTVNSHSGKPKGVVKRGPSQTLHNIFQPHYGAYGNLSSHRTDWLFYEVLDMSLAELETKKLLKIFYLSEGITKEDAHDILVPKTGTVSDIVEPLRRKAELSEEEVQNLRFYEAHSNKVFRELPSDTSVSGFNEWVTIYAEQTPQEELDADENVDRAVFVFHFDKEPSKSHGVPFKFVVKPGEKFADTKERLSKRTGIKGKLLEKVKFATVPRQAFSKPEYLQDDDVLADKLISSEDQLALDHVNKSRNLWNKSDVMMIR